MPIKVVQFLADNKKECVMGFHLMSFEFSVHGSSWFQCLVLWSSQHSGDSSKLEDG